MVGYRARPCALLVLKKPVVEHSSEERAAEEAARDEIRRANKIMMFTAVGVGIAIVLFGMQFLMACGK